MQNLVKRYGDRNAVDGLSFTVADGQVFGFLGPNGAGKSTTMNIMTGYLAPTQGRVLIDGLDIAAEPEAARRRIGYLPELPPLYPDMTVAEYLQFCAELKKLPRAERSGRIAQAVSMTHLEDQTRRLIRSLSKGFRQRVGLAQAVLGLPKVIILDEPTVGLDPRQVVEIRELIRSLAREHTVILSSHILSEIRAVCDHVLIIRKGKPVACDTPQALEEKLSSGGRLTLLAKCSPVQAEDVLAGVDGVLTHTVSNAGADTVRVELSCAGDRRESLFYAFAATRCPLLELRGRTASLEDVFLDLTDEDDAVAARAAALLSPALETDGPETADAPPETEEDAPAAGAGEEERSE
ncbi:ABC transporter ATP-binding protein [uncultured Oscillibacter sp.]|uniref:ABC transporter ATP-binding protein n=1 Tax=uncultured Oscillibacter sp. TaxID=876091 RepID=UPI00345DB8A1